MNIDYDKLPLRYILAVDVKSFFASVEAIRRGLDPLEAFVVVVSDLKRPGAVVLASSAQMKKVFNIKTGNRHFEIPKDERILVVEPSMQLYITINRQIHKIFQDYAADEDILTYSIDESLLDVTSTAHLFGTPWDIAMQIRDRIRNEVGVPVTIGIGDNPLLAKLALDNSAKHRSSQIAYWSYEKIPETIWKIKNMTDFWGISRGYQKRYQALGIRSIYDLAHFSPSRLKQEFGILGLQHYYHSHGVDYTILSQRIAVKNKGFSKGQVLFRDYTHEEEIHIVLSEMVDAVAMRLRHHDYVCRTIQLFVGYSDKEESFGFAKSMRLSAPTNSTSELTEAFRTLFNRAWNKQAVRQFNVSCNDITDRHFEQLDLWNLGEKSKEKMLDEALDNIRDKFGTTAVFKAKSLQAGSTFFTRDKKVGGHKAYTEVE